MRLLARFVAAFLMWCAAFFVAFSSVSMSSSAIEVAAWVICTAIAATVSGLLLLPRTRVEHSLGLQLAACYLGGVIVRVFAIATAHWSPSDAPAALLGAAWVFAGIAPPVLLMSALGPLLAVMALHWIVGRMPNKRIQTVAAPRVVRSAWQRRRGAAPLMR